MKQHFSKRKLHKRFDSAFLSSIAYKARRAGIAKLSPIDIAILGVKGAMASVGECSETEMEQKDHAFKNIRIRVRRRMLRETNGKSSS